MAIHFNVFVWYSHGILNLRWFAISPPISSPWSSSPLCAPFLSTSCGHTISFFTLVTTIFLLLIVGIQSRFLISLFFSSHYCRKTNKILKLQILIHESKHRKLGGKRLNKCTHATGDRNMRGWCILGKETDIHVTL